MFLALPFRSFPRRAFALFALLSAASATLFAQSPSAADGYDPNVDGNVYAMATQPDGKILIAGQFSALRPNGSTIAATRNNLARINPDGSLDNTFNAGTNGAVHALVIQPDGKILIGGDFGTFSSVSASGATTSTPRNCIARLNTDGTVDPTFAASIGSPLPPGIPLQPQVFTIALQADGAVVVGGAFGSVLPAGATTAVARKNIARFSSAGVLDATYNPNPNGMVLALALHVDGKIVVGGGFTSFQENTKTSATTRNGIARLNADGTLDTEFNPNANNGVTSLAVQRDGKIVLGGYFTTLQPIGNDTAANRSHLARLNIDGSLDSEFFPNAGGNVTTIAVQPEGGIVIGGPFTSVWGRGANTVNFRFLARFTPEGAVDTAFDPGVNTEVAAIAFQNDGKIVAGGYFTRVQPLTAPTATVRNHIARLNPNGALDAGFALDAGGRPLASVVQADGKIVIGGSFTNVGGATHNFLARLNADGSVDASYNPDLNSRVIALAYEASSGKIIVGGSFTTVGGEPRNHIARLNPSGTIDSEFNPNIDGQVGTIVVQSDGKILVGGTFANVQPLGATTPTPRNNILRLNADGKLDTTFDPNTNSTVTSIVVQSDNKIILGGNFTTLSPNGKITTTDGITTNDAIPVSRNNLARINGDGTLDTAYNPNFNSQVNALALQGDGKLVAGGTFTAMAPPGATEATIRQHLVRINTDGTIDLPFDPNANDVVLALAIQSDGKILIGGPFTTLTPNGATDWTLRKYAARLNADGTVDSTFNLDIDELGGNRVDSIRILPDGRILLGGNFNSFQPLNTATRISRKNFARINANGSLDTAFDVGAGGSTSAQINAIAIQADGKIVTAGSFADLGGAKTTNIARFMPEGNVDPGFSTSLSTDGPVNTVAVRPTGAPASSQLAGFAWLNRDGTLRTGFSPDPNVARLSGRVNAMAFQTDGSVLVAGSFTNLTNATGANFARFNPAGVLDTSFNPSVGGAINGVVLQSDGRIIVVGAFTTVAGLSRNHIARLNTDGSLDAAYDPNVNGDINAVVIQSDDKVVIGGTFTTLTPNGTATAVTRNFVARINTDGTLETGYNPNPNGTVNALAIQPSDGKVIIGGQFTTLQPNDATATIDRHFIARLNVADGSLDQNFNPNPNAAVFALLAQPDGSIVLGGSFTTLQPGGGTVATVTRYYLARVRSDGSLDNFNPYPNSAVTALALQSDGAILVGGVFTTLQPSGQAITRNHLARVSADGSLDAAFNPDPAGSVNVITVRADGSVLVGGDFATIQPAGLLLVGGSFATIGGVSAKNLALLNEDGSVNSTFLPAPNGAINTLLVLPDGKFIVGGAFTSIAGSTRNRIARFNADGTLDMGYNPNASNVINALAVQPDGKVLVAGQFGTIAGQSRNGLARLNADGSLDASFNSGINYSELLAKGLTVLADGSILITGDPNFGSNTAPEIRKLNSSGVVDGSFAAGQISNRSLIGIPDAVAVQSDGRIILAVRGPATRLIRLNANGTIDSSFSPAPNGAVTALALQSDGRLMIGGSFTTIGGLQHIGLARLASTGSTIQLLGVTSDRKTLVWNRSGQGGELASVTFEQSIDDRHTWTVIGTGTRITQGWQLTNLSLPPAGTPPSGTFYIRARGIAPSSSGRSSSLYESVREFNFGSTNFAPPSAGFGSVQIPESFTIDPFTGLVHGQVVPLPVIGSIPSTGTPPADGSDGSATLGARLADIAARGSVSAGTPLIAGFAIGGSEPRTVLLRAIGPTLAAFHVDGVLAAPELRLYDGDGHLMFSRSGWAADLSAVFVQTGAFPFSAGSTDAAATATLAPGNYSLHVVDSTGAGGIAMAEVYDVAGATQASRLTNLSSRGTVIAGNAAFIGGIVLSGNTSKQLLVRGIGPGLAKFGVSGTMTDPSISVYDSLGHLLASNDNWGDPSIAGSSAANAAAVSTAAAKVGAFGLESGSNDAALTITLPPGAYSVHVSGPEGSTGAALLEVYELP